ncbi:MAG TPA: response regulator transcription factor [Candidatus Obscuribacterales bacterium]
MRILLAEDDEILSDGISKALVHCGFAVDKVTSGADADIALGAHAFDLAILDLGLPGMDGLEVLKRLRGRGKRLPVLILTARAGLDTRVAGLDLGADDYITKPFDLPELEARVRALIRRSNYGSENEITYGPIKFDIAGRSLTADNQPVELSAREVGVLELLLQRPGRVVSKEQLMEHMYGWDNEVSQNAIEVLIHRLRKRLEPFGIGVRTVRGLGYLLEMTE